MHTIDASVAKNVKCTKEKNQIKKQMRNVTR